MEQPYIEGKGGRQITVVRVGGKEYKLVSADSPEHMHRVAAYVDRQLEELSMASGLPANQVAVLAALNMADELLKSHDENSRLRREYIRTCRELDELRKQEE